MGASSLLGFQFHKGTIKTTSTLILLWLHLDFNSIKVQLKPVETDWAFKLSVISIP